MEVKIIVPKFPNGIAIGEERENLAVPVVVDYTAWIEQHGAGALQILLQRPQDADPYPVTVTNDNGEAVWTPNETDMNFKGRGEIQLVYTAGGVIERSPVIMVISGRSLVAAGDPPDPFETWLEELTELAAETLVNAQSAEDSASEANADALRAAQSALDAEAAKTGAEAAEQTAQQAATLARAKAAEAAEAAQIAGENADYAQQQRVMAEADAVDAHDSAESAAQSAEDAQAAASAAQTAASAAAASASAAAGSAADAASAVTEVETKGAEQITAINQAGTTQIAAVDAAGAVQVQAIEDKGEEVVASIPSDYTELVDEVSDLKSATAHISTPTETEADLYICDSNGNVIAKFVDGHIVTKNFDSGAIQLDLIMEADSNEADLYIADSFGNVVAEFRDGHIVTKYFDSADYADVLSDLAGVISDVAALQSATSGIMYRTQSFVDGVYAACKFRTTSNHQFCLLAAGDCHSNADGPANLIKYLNEVDSVDCAVMLGDIVSNVFADGIDHYTQALLAAQKPVLTVLGNHDVRGATSDAELWAKYGALYEYADLASGEAVDGKCYYYKDFASQKMRVIVLMQYDYIYTGELCFGQTQIDWLINTLTNTPSDYAVIICEHTNPSRYMTYNMDAAYTANTWKRSNYSPTVMDGDPVPDIINAWINGAALTKTYAYTFENPPSPLSVNVDFSSRGAGEFVTYLGGHWHQNVLGNVTDHTDQMDFHTQANSYSPTTWSGDIARKIGTVSEDSFCAVAVDRDSKTVKIFQVGAHFTDAAVDRQYFKYSYGEAGD